MRVGIATSEPETGDPARFWQEAHAVGAQEVRLVVYRNNPALLDRVREALLYRKDVRVAVVLIDGPHEPLNGFPEWAAGVAVELPAVYRFIVWNEPNAHAFWSHGPTDQARAVSYARLLRQTTVALKASRPVPPVVSAFGLAPHPRPRLFLQAAMGALAAVDSLSVHLYPGTARDGVSGVLRLLRGIEADVPGVPVYVDEFGWNAGPGCTEERQAGLYRDLLAGLRADPRVRTALVYRLRDGEGWTSGPLRADGTRRPAHAVLSEKSTNAET